MMRDAFSRGDIAEIDFGCGDDPYKQEWLPERRQRWMITAYDPLSYAGRPHAPPLPAAPAAAASDWRD